MAKSTLIGGHFFLLVALFCRASIANALEYECRDVGPTWVELGWHIVARIEYQLVADHHAVYEIGTGVFLWGEPRGSKYPVSGIAEVEAYGYGSLAARSQSNQTLKVCFSASEVDPITIYSAEF